MIEVMRPCPSPAIALPTGQELEAMYTRKHGSPETVGWMVRRRLRFGYFLPADVYEAVVDELVFPGCSWLDVGGGHNVFPENPGLSRELVSRCAKMVAVDPSSNVAQNKYAHECVQSTLEEYNSGAQFDLATMRMVVEHVARPKDFVGRLAQLIRPGGYAVVLTVNRRSPISLLSWLLPFRLHHPVKRFFWGGEEEDTFPVQYLMNTRSELNALLSDAGFSEVLFHKLADLSAFGMFRMLNYLELLAWDTLRRVGIGYPESCLLGVYRRSADDDGVTYPTPQGQCQSV